MRESPDEPSCHKIMALMFKDWDPKKDLDPKTVALTGRVKVGEVLKYGDIDTGGGMVWLRTTESQTLAVVDPKTMTVTARVGPAQGSGALRYTSGGVWTSAHDVHTVTWWPKKSVTGK